MKSTEDPFALVSDAFGLLDALKASPPKAGQSRLCIFRTCDTGTPSGAGGYPELVDDYCVGRLEPRHR